MNCLGIGWAGLSWLRLAWVARAAQGWPHGPASDAPRDADGILKVMGKGSNETRAMPVFRDV